MLNFYSRFIPKCIEIFSCLTELLWQPKLNSQWQRKPEKQSPTLESHSVRHPWCHFPRPTHDSPWWWRMFSKPSRTSITPGRYCSPIHFQHGILERMWQSYRWRSYTCHNELHHFGKWCWHATNCKRRGTIRLRVLVRSRASSWQQITKQYSVACL